MPEIMRGVVTPFEECQALTSDTESFFVWVACEINGPPQEPIVIFKLAVEIDGEYFGIDKEIINSMHIKYPAPFLMSNAHHLQNKVKQLRDELSEANGNIIEAHTILMQMESLDELPEVFEALGYQPNGLSKY